jgi:hypothetical protein
MYRQNFGTKNQVHFNNPNEYYETLGYLAKSDGSTKLVWEHNEQQGAWGSEGRIQFFVPVVPIASSLDLTSGVGNVTYRLNCNEFVEHISTNHNFIMGNTQNLTSIRSTVPTQYIPDFDRGLNL